MFDLGWSEMLLVAMLAILVVGPRDLPRLMRTAGRWLGRARAMAHDFRRNLERMADAVEIEDLERDLKRRVDIPDATAKPNDPDSL